MLFACTVMPKLGASDVSRKTLGVVTEGLIAEQTVSRSPKDAIHMLRATSITRVNDLMSFSFFRFFFLFLSVLLDY